MINISAHDYAFIDFIVTHSLCKLFLISSILLIKSKLIWKFNEKHSTSITHQIMIGLWVTDHFKLFCLLLIIMLSQHDLILKKIWMNCHRVLLNISVNELHFLLRRCDHSEVFTAVLPVKNLLKVNLSLSHWRITMLFKTLVSLIKIFSVKISSVSGLQISCLSYTFFLLRDLTDSTSDETLTFLRKRRYLCACFQMSKS